MRKASKLFVLCMLAALSVMALSAAAAQAENEFLLNGETFAEAGIGSKEIKGTVGEGELLTEGNLKIHCNKGSGTGTVFQGGTANAQATLEECTVLENAQCTVYDGLKVDNDKTTLFNPGIILASGKGHLFKHPAGSKNHYLLVEGLEKETLTKHKLLFSLFDIYGKFCPLNEGTQPLHVEITGSSVVKLVNPLVNQAAHELESIAPETLATLFPEDQLFFGEEKAHLGGGIKATVELTSGENWSSN